MTIHGTGRLEDPQKKGDSARDGTSAELRSDDIPLVTCRKKGIQRVSDTMGDESLPGIIMEQEELSDSEEEFGENVEFECEEMADSEGDGMTDSEQTAHLPSEPDEMDPDIDVQTISTRGGLLQGSNGKRVNLKTNVTAGYEFGPFGTTGVFGRNQLLATSKGSNRRHVKPGSGDGLRRNHRKRVCRWNSNTSIAGCGRGDSSPNVDTSVGKLGDC